jgi:hypothetical protein
MAVFFGGHRIPARPVRPSFRDPRFVFLLVGQSAGWVCSWAASLLPLPEEPRNAGAIATGRPAYGLSWFRAATTGAVAVAREPGLRAIALARMGVVFTSGAFLVIEPLYTGMCCTSRRPSSRCSKRRPGSERS